MDWAELGGCNGIQWVVVRSSYGHTEHINGYSNKDLDTLYYKDRNVPEFAHSGCSD